MLYRYYYINGKRVSEDQYYAAKELESYKEAALKRAVEYYKQRQWEWRHVVFSLRSTPTSTDLLMFWEQTEDGKQFQKEWQKKMEQAEKTANIITGLLWVGFFIIILCVLFSGHQ